MTSEQTGGPATGDREGRPDSAGATEGTVAAVVDAPSGDELTPDADAPEGAGSRPGTVEADLADLARQPLADTTAPGEAADRGGGPSDERSPGDAAVLQERAFAAVAPIADGDRAPADDGVAGVDPPAGDVDIAEAPAPIAIAVERTEVEQAPPATDGPVETARDDGPEPTTMEELLNEQSGDIRSFKHGDVVEGTVVRIDKDEILVDIGAKSEGVVSNRELYGRNAEAPQLSIGDNVLVYVLQPESTEGHAVLSLRRAGLERKWRAMQELFDAGTIIEAPVIDHNKGGLIVDCGIRGFVPISQIVDFPRRPQNEQPRDAAQEIAEKLQPFVGRKLRLKILEVNRKANRLILSEKVALYEERREKRDELFSSLRVGQQVTGSVRSIAPFGVFIDLGGIDGLVHKSELSWNKVNNPEHGYKVGDEVQAEVIDINHERGRISLSIRRLQPDPWHSTVADLNVGDVIDGTVTKIVNFGAFVRVRDGLEGLIHISELSNQRVAHPGDVVHEGQRLKLKVISLDSERHRLGLSLKQAEEPPARPAPAETPAPRERERDRERRPRADRGYDPSQAVQEPEGGIDNTLAAAFAQVRRQVAESEQRGALAESAMDSSAYGAASSPEVLEELSRRRESEPSGAVAVGATDTTDTPGPDQPAVPREAGDLRDVSMSATGTPVPSVEEVASTAPAVDPVFEPTSADDAAADPTTVEAARTDDEGTIDADVAARAEAERASASAADAETLVAATDAPAAGDTAGTTAVDRDAAGAGTDDPAASDAAGASDAPGAIAEPPGATAEPPATTEPTEATPVDAATSIAPVDDAPAGVVADEDRPAAADEAVTTEDPSAIDEPVEGGSETGEASAPAAADEARSPS